MNQTVIDIVASNDSADKFRLFHLDLPLQGDTPNGLFQLSDDVILYIVAAVRNEPRKPPEISDAEWDRTINLLSQHGILPVIRSHVRLWPDAFRPPLRIMVSLDQVYVRSAARNLLIESQVRSVLTGLQDAGVPVLIIKGQALARTIYPDLVLRHSNDIDLLVKPEDVDRCDKVLRNMGYSCQFRSFTQSELGGYHDSYFPSGIGVNIEIHWTLSCTYNLFPDGWLDAVFSRKIPLRSNTITGYTLHPSDHLLYLVFHNIFQHDQIRLDWVYDMALLMALLKAPEDWQSLQEQCSKSHLIIPMKLAITAATLWSNVEIPQDFKDFSLWPSPSSEDKRLWEHSRKRNTSFRSNFYLTFQGQHGIREKIKYCCFFIFPPVSYIERYRKSPSITDIPLAHFRRWFNILKLIA